MKKVRVYSEEFGEARSIYIDPGKISIVAYSEERAQDVGEVITDVMIEGSWFTLRHSLSEILDMVENELA